MSESVRSCVVCRGRCEKYSLVRIVLSEGEVVWDRDQKLPGRGAYLHPREECLGKAHDASRWERGLRLAKGTLAGGALMEALRAVRRDAVQNL